MINRTPALPRPIYSLERRVGPEAVMEDVIVTRIPDLLPVSERPSCIFGSRTVGAGAPDLTVVYCPQDISMPVHGHPRTIDILAYLRVVNQATAATLRNRLRITERVLEECLDCLWEVRALRRLRHAIALEPEFRHPLSEVVTIEAKVSKWQQAVSQASRNLVFCHRSFVALPDIHAFTAAQDARVAMLGIGVISVSDSSAHVVRRSRRTQPRVWRYYFELAVASARQLRP